MDASAFVVRKARESDSAGLLDLVATPTLGRGVRWSIERTSDFFTPFRAEADGWQVLVAEDEHTGTQLGCLSVAARRAYLNGRVEWTCYVSNFLVGREWRGRGIGDALCRHAAEFCRSVAGDDTPVLVVIRDGNRHMSGRVAGPRGLPELRPVARVAIHTISAHRLRAADINQEMEIRPAVAGDLEAMAALSRGVFAERHFAPAFDAASLERWITGAPGLELSDHLVAREGGAVVGWLGIWHEEVVRRVRLAGYARSAGLRYALRDALRHVTGVPRVPRVGELVGSAAAVHPCISKDRPDVLRALLQQAAARAHPVPWAWLKVALDRRDPLGGAFSGLRARVAYLRAYVTTPAGSRAVAALDDGPLHFETALA